jgi:hypothetical protein
MACDYINKEITLIMSGEFDAELLSSASIAERSSCWLQIQRWWWGGNIWNTMADNTGHELISRGDGKAHTAIWHVFRKDYLKCSVMTSETLLEVKMKTKYKMKTQFLPLEHNPIRTRNLFCSVHSFFLASYIIQTVFLMGTYVRHIIEWEKLKSFLQA